MKKLIIAAAVAGFISLGFTLVNTTQKKTVSKEEISEKMDFSQKLNEKKLASWD
jgi:hypothetical protein